jgi:MFS family permease
VTKQKIYHGYWVLGCCFTFCLVVLGCSNMSFSLFIKLLQEAQGWSRTEIMAAFTILIVVNGVTSPFIGLLVDRFGARAIISLGALLVTVGLLVLSRMVHLRHLYFAYVLIGMGSTAAGPLSLSYVASNWFQRNRGRAVGVVAMGMGGAAIVFVPLIAVYLIPRFGWRGAYLVLGAINAALVVPACWFVLRTRPSDMGLHPDGIGLSEAVDGPRESTSAKRPRFEGVSLKMAVATPAFWLIGASLLFFHTHLGVLLSVFPHLMDIGFSAGIAASVLSVYGVAGTLSQFSFGWLCDKITARRASAIGLGLTVAGILILICISPRSPMPLIWTYAVVMGFGVGSWLPTMSMLTSSTFGMVSYGAIFGLLSIFQNIGGATGPLIAGSVYDSTHAFLWSFVTILILVAVAIPLVLMVKRPAEAQPGEHFPPRL